MVCYQGDDPIPMNQRIVVSIGFIMILTLSVLVASNQVPKSFVEELEQPPKFVLASWSYPDEYGQGILQVQVEENSTGDWESDDLRHYYENHEYDWNASLFIRLRLWVWMNNTVVGAEDLDDGWNHQRLNVTVTQDNGTVVFSQQGFTHHVCYDTQDPMWDYQWYVILNFLPEAGVIYNAAITYEIFW